MAIIRAGDQPLRPPAKTQADGAALQQPPHPGQLGRGKKAGAQKVVGKLNANGVRARRRRELGGPRVPGVRQVATQQHQIARGKIADVVADEASSFARDDQRQFIFRMKVPAEREAAQLERPIGERAMRLGDNAFETGLHGRKA